jgi:cell division protein FtsZ
MFELIENLAQTAVIKVIGVGGGGGNAVRHMVDNDVTGVEFICANTDAQALKAMDNGIVLKIGGGVTKGLGAGANPDVGRQAAMEDRDRIAEVLRGADMVFITAGMGGGTGTGAAPVVAQVAREMGILTVAVVTKPFPFEGKKRMLVAQQGLAELAEHVDSLITVPNEKLLTAMDKSVTMLSAFKAANDVLLGAVQGIAELIINDGLINVDFADVRTVMSEMGVAMMGTGKATGENRAREAAEAAIRCPLLDNIDLQGARGILVNVTAGHDLTMGEFEEVGNTIHEFASDTATVVVGTVLDPEMSGELRVTVVATGLGHKAAEVKQAPTKVVDNTVAPKGYQAPAPNYAELDRPAVMRQGNNSFTNGNFANSSYQPGSNAGSKAQYGNSAAGGTFAATAQASSPVIERTAAPVAGDDLDYLDIPAFLRRQAD